jgi:predicted HAD superfamily hydrolase
MTGSQPIASFDVFDTVLTRTVCPPSSVFLLVGARLREEGLITSSPESFGRARLQAEHVASSNRRRHARLSEIYQEFVSVFAISEDRIPKFVECELTVESELIRPVPGMAARIAREKEQGRRIVFVSDMYLPSDFLIRMLDRFGLWSRDARCYVSSEHGHSKASGQLFRTLLSDLGARPSDLHHVGNDPTADVRGARRAGCTSELFAQCNEN